MIFQEIDGIPFKMKAPFDFGFLKGYGRVFRVFDNQDSGNICFGIEGAQGRQFLKFAGAPTARYAGDAAEAVHRLTAAEPVYREIRHRALAPLLGAQAVGGGFALLFAWREGVCMGRMYPQGHQQVMGLPLKEKLGIFEEITGFLKETAARGYVAIDFYDGCILYNQADRRTAICDIDFFCRAPAVNDMGRMWGSSRFMSPEEYQLGAALDEITNVFTLGQMGFSLFTDSDRSREGWPLPEAGYAVLQKAIRPERSGRYPDIAAFEKAWQAAVC